MKATTLYPVGRALVGVLFLASGINKLFGFAYVAGFMNSSGIPAAGLLLALTIALEVGGGLALITGCGARWAALGLALFTIPVTLLFHAFWHVDAAELQNTLNHFLKNVAIFGGLLVLFGAEQERAVLRAERTALLRGRSA